MKTRPLILVTGKGGVGKSTVACGLSTALSKSYPTTLIQLYRSSGEVGDQVTRWILDPARCVEQVAGEIIGSPKLARFIARRRAVSPLMASAEAIKAFAILEYVHRRVDDETRVVLDMPATGHALAWLRSVRLLREASRSGRAHDMAVALEKKLFHEDRTEVWAVTLPEPFVVTETRALIDAIRRERSLPTRVVVNRLPPKVSQESRDQAEILGLHAIADRLHEWSLAAVTTRPLDDIVTVPKLGVVGPTVVSQHLQAAL